MDPTGPQMAFKEWSLVCDALLDGRQSLILRKGGIHEGRGGFRFEHHAFWLFPTFFHAQAEGFEAPDEARAGVRTAPQQRDEVVIGGWCEVEWIDEITEWPVVERLRPFHGWTDETLQQRFAWGEEEALHAAFVRVHRLPQPWCLPFEKRYGGCRSWVPLPPVPEVLWLGAEPVLADGAHAWRAAEIEAALGRGLERRPAQAT